MEYTRCLSFIPDLVDDPLADSKQLADSLACLIHVLSTSGRLAPGLRENPCGVAPVAADDPGSPDVRAEKRSDEWKYLRDKYAKEAAKVAGTERSGFGTSDVCKPKWIYFGSLRFLTVILVFKLLPRCWVDREAKGRRLLLNHLLARDVRQMADVVLINPHPFFLNREKAPKREYFTADGYLIHRILEVRKMSKLIKVHVKKKLGAQWIGVRHCLELPQIYSCSHCTLVQPLQDKRPQVVVVPELHPPPITMPASHRLPAIDTILAVPDLPNRMTGEGL
ncbi:hypothetical protein HPB47_016754 [Ixodes persulcatus]|uniref:Uncharacterized protein n=1 Tax=Ixodes persulcatus TaxID=34615 RepID=A0AC60QQ34_IXOPE|nr:hypothetical protein HPB47_016754 [Ixodes persulcatus]